MSAQLRVADLDEPDQRLYRLAREPIPLAEMAVRLGVTIALADQRIAHLCARFGLADRRALQQYEEPTEEPVGEAQPAPPDSAEATEIERPGARGRTFTRRQVLTAIGGGVATIGAGAWLWSQSTPHRAAATPPISTTAAPERPPHQLSIQRDDSGWELRGFAPGEAITWDSGAFFLSLGSGRTEAVRSTAPSTEALPTLRVEGVELVLSSRMTASGSVTSAWDRSLGRGFRWSDREVSLAAVLHDSLLFEELQPDSPRGGMATGRYRLVDFDLNAISVFELPTAPRSPEPVLVSPDGTRGAFWSVDGDNLTLHRVMLETGDVETELFVGPTRGAPFIPASYQAIAASDHFACVVSRPAGSSQDAPAPAAQYTLPWEGNWGRTVPVVGPAIGSWAPGGEIGLRQDYLPGTTASWPVSVVQSLDGKILFSVRSAAVAYPGAPLGTPWLADRSGFIALVTSNDARETPGFAIIDASGRDITPLPATHGGVRAPHPGNPNLIAFDRFNAWNRSTGEETSANVPGGAGNQLVDPWCGRADELVFVLPGYTSGIPLPPALLRPRVAPLVLDRSLTVRVAGGGNGLDLREIPLSSSAIRARIADAAPLLISDDLEPGGLVTSFVRNNDGCWAHVTSLDGKTSGWARSSGIAWA